jgi:hypothetical protein
MLTLIPRTSGYYTLYIQVLLGGGQQVNIFRPLWNPLWTLEDISTLKHTHPQDLHTTKSGDKVRGTPIQVEEWSPGAARKGTRGCPSRQIMRHSLDGRGLQLLQQVDLWSRSGQQAVQDRIHPRRSIWQKWKYGGRLQIR